MIGEDEPVADAIAEHYRPLGPNDTCPTAPVSVVVALADKIDTLVAFFAIGEKPTGSRDPFALRRAARASFGSFSRTGSRLPLAEAFAGARSGPGIPAAVDLTEIQVVVDELLAFIADRLKVHLRDQGVRHDLIAAVFAQLGPRQFVTGRTRTIWSACWLASVRSMAFSPPRMAPIC